jgi:hypothetical protein
MSPPQGQTYYRGSREGSMTTAENGEYLTGPRLTARLIALKGVAPDPVAHVIFRSTRRVDGSLLEGYIVRGEAQPLDTDTLEDWLTARLGNVDRLAVAILVIREILDTSGMILQCTIERRRGSVDGPFCGDPVRVDFAGPATAVRLYRNHPDGRLTEITPSTDVAPPRLRSPDQFAGEHKALQSRFGAHVHIVDSREPTLFEDMVGLSSVAHIRTADGREIGCGIGWFGDMPFVLEADFPRFSAPLDLPDEHATTVDAALRDNDMVRGETRLDENGIAITGRKRGSDALYLVRPDLDGARIEPHIPGREAAGPDQQRWLHYAETYEGLTVLDVWRDGGSDDIIALTGDLSGQIWRHHIDVDGVETWRKVDDEAAIGAVHRENLFPGTLVDADTPPKADQENNGAGPEEKKINSADRSLFAQADAYMRAIAASRAAQEADADDANTHLKEMLSALETLGAHVTTNAVRELMARFDAAMLPWIEQSLRQELASIHCVAVTPPRARLLRTDEPPFGMRVAIAFPSIGYDIDEAASCLALRRTTASAIHCQRIIEVGIAALARCLGVTNPLASGQRDWQALLDAFPDKDDARHALDALARVRSRWRSIGLVAGEKYTEEEAERIFASVDAFLRALAELCDERGIRPESSQQT